MLKDLKIPVARQKSEVDKNIAIACGIIDDIFGDVEICLRENRSSVKIGMGWKGFMLGALPMSRDGTKEFVAGMSGEDIRKLLLKIRNRMMEME